ncbi:CrcB family protein [Nocardioides sp.]|uniref:fluoride efflux transporter FluC n=1 Tax=Nocardioides sp. TaxID=35761 RepID=UPI0019B89E41|nr:CrcB family protein [Nocardioides sp.]MBC7277133.1 CrcB family protein [Nocardioides sp.]
MLREHRDLLAPIAAGGSLGSLARWGLAEALPQSPQESTWPWATLLANVSGCLLLGLLMAFVLGPWSTVPFWGRYLRPFLGVGVLGGYTTFSTYELEMYVLIGHAPALAMLYLLVSVVAGVAAVWLGLTLGRVIVLDSGREVVVGCVDPDLGPDPAPDPGEGEQR